MLVRCFPSLVAAFAVFALGTAGMARAQPEPTMVISPSSGPCDATLEVIGSGFAPRMPPQGLVLYLLQPGTSDVNMGSLSAAFVEADGGFTDLASLHDVGCEAAQVDSAAAKPTGRLVIAAAWNPGGPPVARGEPIPDIIAVAQYEYTTTTPYVPTETMEIFPTSGPCDATVEVSGHGFPPSTAIRLDMGVPKGDGSMGKLASLTTDASGRFVTNVDLGALGCRAAVLDDHFTGQLGISADLEERVIEAGHGIPPILTRTGYTYTTSSTSPTPGAFPGTGSGPDPRPTPLTPLSLAGLLTALGIVLLLAPLCARRLRS